MSIATGKRIPGTQACCLLAPATIILKGVTVYMDWATIISFIQGVGFPIACVLIMFQQMDKEREAHKEETERITLALNNNTLILTELKQKLEDMDKNED